MVQLKGGTIGIRYIQIFQRVEIDMLEDTVGGYELCCFRSAILVGDEPSQSGVDIEVRIAEIDVDLGVDRLAPVVTRRSGAEMSAELIRSMLRGDQSRIGVKNRI